MSLLPYYLQQDDITALKQRGIAYELAGNTVFYRDYKLLKNLPPAVIDVKTVHLKQDQLRADLASQLPAVVDHGWCCRFC